MNYSITDILDELNEMFCNLSIDVVEVDDEIEDTIYITEVYFNDRFYYSTSDVLIFENNWKSIVNMYDDIKKWYDSEGKSLLTKLNEVKWPNQPKDEQTYFEENQKIGKEIWNSVDRYFKTNNNWK